MDFHKGNEREQGEMFGFEFLDGCLDVPGAENPAGPRRGGECGLPLCAGMAMLDVAFVKVMERDSVHGLVGPKAVFLTTLP